MLSKFVQELNQFVDPVTKLFQHGANDEFWKTLKGWLKDTTTLGNRNIGESFVVCCPSGRVEVMDLRQMEHFYKTYLKIHWPLN